MYNYLYQPCYQEPHNVSKNKSNWFCIEAMIGSIVYFNTCVCV